MSAIAHEFEYLIRRAQKEKNEQLVEQLTRRYEQYLDEATR